MLYIRTLILALIATAVTSQTVYTGGILVSDFYDAACTESMGPATCVELNTCIAAPAGPWGGVGTLYYQASYLSGSYVGADDGQQGANVYVVVCNASTDLSSNNS